MSGIALDVGALIAFEKLDRAVIARIDAALRHKEPIVVPAGVVGQVWRDGSKQARLARLLAAPHVEVEVLDDMRARAAGELCRLARTDDPIDASVVGCARARKLVVLTSDPDDLRRIDPMATLVRV